LRDDGDLQVDSVLTKWGQIAISSRRKITHKINGDKGED
jgi:hypothetical protein